MDLLLVLAAGAVQGLTEFLPISSTAHLIIFEKIFHLSSANYGLAFDASLHLGTFLAVVFYFFKDYLKLLNLRSSFLPKIVIGTLPAIILGLFLESAIEDKFRNLLVISTAFIIFSFVMLAAQKVAKQNKNRNDLSFGQALFVGFFQALALIPGISRSGSTISAGLFSGLKKDEAAKFAFMLSGPIIAGAGAKKFFEVVTNNSGVYDLNFFLVGIISSFVFGYLTIKYFIRYLSTNDLTPFIAYRIILGISLLIYSLTIK